MIIIGYNPKGQPISILKAKSKELAIAYWHGAGILPHSTSTDEDFNIETNGTGVIPLLKTREISASSSNGFSSNNKILTIETR